MNLLCFLAFNQLAKIRVLKDAHSFERILGGFSQKQAIFQVYCLKLFFLKKSSGRSSLFESTHAKCRFFNNSSASNPDPDTSISIKSSLLKKTETWLEPDILYF